MRSLVNVKGFRKCGRGSCTRDRGLEIVCCCRIKEIISRRGETERSVSFDVQYFSRVFCRSVS